MKDYEPKIALNPGYTGLESYLQIFNIVPDLLKHTGYCVIEIGYNQKDIIMKLIKQFGYNIVKFANDYGNKPRMIIFRI